MKKITKSRKPTKIAKAPQSEEDKKLEYADRLAELEAELKNYPERTTGSPPAAIPSVTRIKAAKLHGESAVQFTHRGKTFSVGHTDITFPGSNHTRGVRKVHFYDESEVLVFGIIGDFENHQFGANFRFREQQTFIPGPWETAFLTITSGLREFRADRKEDLRKRRAVESRRNHWS